MNKSFKNPDLLEKTYSALLVFYFFVMPVFAVFVPRALGSVPIVIGILGFIVFFFAGQRPKIDKGFLRGVFIFLIVIWASVFSGGGAEFIVERAVKISTFLISATGFLAAVVSLKDQHKKNILRYLPWSIAAAVILMMVDYGMNYFIYQQLHETQAPVKKLSSVFNRGMVAYVIWVWPAGLYLLYNNVNRVFIAALFGLVLLSLFVVYSSQSAIFGFISGLICWAGTKYAKKIFPLFVFICIALGVLLAPFIAKGLYIWQPEILTNWHAASAQQRIVLWNAVATEALKSPVYGHGLEATRMMPEALTQHTSRYRWEDIFHPHNFALQIWIEGGVIAVLLFQYLLLSVYRWLRRCDDRSKPFVAGMLVTILGVAAVGYGVWQSWWLGVLVTTCVALHLSLKAERLPT